MSPRERTVSLALIALLVVGLVLWSLVSPSIEGVGEQPTPSNTVNATVNSTPVAQIVRPTLIARGSQQQQFPLETLPVRPDVTPSATPSPTAKPTDRPESRPKSTPKPERDWSRQMPGKAKWYATGKDGQYAAAGPALRRALGEGWRGSYVLVCIDRPGRQSRCLEVRLNDWCKCKGGKVDTLIDLSDEAFSYLAPLSRGVIIVTVAW